MKRGRKPLDPTIVRLRSTRKGTVIPITGTEEKIRCPQKLTGAGRNKWRNLIPKLKKLGIISAVDRDALFLYCDAYREYVEMSELIKSPVVRTVGGNLIQHPALAVRNAAYKRMLQIAKEIGLTPAARVNLNVSAKPKTPADRARFFGATKERPGA